MRERLFSQKLIIVSFALITFATACPAVAQSVGVPIGARQSHQLTLSLRTAYDQKRIAGLRQVSPRIVLKTLYGVTSIFDVFLELGLAKLDVQSNSPDLADFHDRFHMAFGGGATLRVIRFRGVGLATFISARAFRYTSTPTSHTTVQSSLTEITQMVSLNYDHRELDFNLGFVKNLRFLDMYLGANQKWISRLENRVNSTTVNGKMESSFSEKGEYKSGLQIAPYLGFDIRLPASLTISLEMRFKNTSDFFLSFGLSQAGSPER